MKTMQPWPICLFLVLLTLTLNPAADASWLSKGLDTVKELSAPSSQSQTTSNASLDEIGQAFKEALHMGTDKVVGQLGALDGFNNDAAVHIPLPDTLQTVKSYLAKVGMSQSVDDLELKLNRAAEAATPKAKALFFDAISTMTFTDLQSIYNGPEDSATSYFKSKMSPQLVTEMQPIVAKSLSEVGAIQAYEQVIGKYKSLPFVPDVTANLQEYVVQKGIEGIFYYVAKEEAAIRKDPAKQTTALLKKVFGSNN